MASKMNVSVKTYFVLFANHEDELSTSNEMQQAFEMCREYGMAPLWIRERDDSVNLCKHDIVVFENFIGDYYTDLKGKTWLVVGPRCLLTCLLQGIQVPTLEAPIFNMAMYGTVVTATRFNKFGKRAIQDVVEKMGGLYRKDITSGVTHLVAEAARSQKYILAKEKGILVIKKEFLNELWRLSQNSNVTAKDIDKNYECPVLYNLEISSTGFSIPERNELKDIITKHGGNFSGKMFIGKTEVLICQVGTFSEKMTVAKRENIPCVTREWLKDSIKIGYNLPEDQYVLTVTCSTPNKTTAPTNPDFSMMSSISTVGGRHDMTCTSVCESLVSSLYEAPDKQHKAPEQTEIDLVESIDINQVKKAGSFLDGCLIYLLGYNPVQREKLCKILKMAGAIRYDEISHQVTHILVGNENSSELKTISGGFQIPVVSTKWLIESMRMQQPVHEEPFSVKLKPHITPAPASPLSEKALNLLQHNSSTIEKKKPGLIEPQTDIDESVKLYVKPNRTTEEDTLVQLLANENFDSKFGNANTRTDDKSSAVSEESETLQEESGFPQIFEGKNFKLVGLDETSANEVGTAISEMGGILVPKSSKGITDYVVAPVICKRITHTALEIVNQLWVMECNNLEKIIGIQFYHQPLQISSVNKPLANCVITITGYTLYMRTFFQIVIEHLGGRNQDQFVKQDRPAKGLVMTTHLLCNPHIPTSTKREAALRWGQPIVSAEWLMRCAETDSRVDESQFNPIKQNNESTVLETAGKNKRLIGNANVVTSTESGQEDTSPKKMKLIDIAIKKSEQAIQKNDSPNIEGTKTASLAEELNPDKENHDVTTPFKGFPSQQVSENVSEHIPNLNPSTEPSDKVSVDRTISNINVVTLEDGSKQTLDQYLQDLRDKGVFDTPSPVPHFSTTPIRELMAKGLQRFLNKKADTPTQVSASSQSTPVTKYLRDLQQRNVLPVTPKNTSMVDSPLPKTCLDVATPDTPLGRFLYPDPSPATRKRWEMYLERFPHYKCHDRKPLPKQTNSPSWSEEKRKFWNRMLGQNTSSTENNDNETEAVEQTKESIQENEVNKELDKLENMIIKNRESLAPKSGILKLDGATPQKEAPHIPLKPADFEIKDSQSERVLWDEATAANNIEPAVLITRKFMFSGIDIETKEACIKIIESLNGEVSHLTHYDPAATHLISKSLMRNEKVLCCIAAGKWILNVKYLEDSAEQGKFLVEDLYEFGSNHPDSIAKDEKLVEQQKLLAEAAHWWRIRSEVTGYGAFSDVKGLLFTNHAEQIIRLIEAGGGTVVNASPPFTHDIDITHCFIDPKFEYDLNSLIPLAKQGIHCVNILYLSTRLIQKNSVDVSKSYLSSLRPYYN